MPVTDQGAPTGGRGIKLVTSNKKRGEIEDLIDDIVASNVNRTVTKNSVYTSDNYHVDSVPVTASGGLKRCKVEVQERTGTKETVAVAILEMHVTSDTDVRSALNQSLGNQHIFLVS